MGNDNEMMNTGGRSLFLSDEIHDREGKGLVYVLEEEFEKSKRNRNLRLYAFLVVFLAIVGGSVFLFRFWSDRHDSIFDVDITDFEDLRLKEVMSSARKRRGNIDVLRIELQMLEVAMLEDILNVRRDTHSRERALLDGAPPDDETDRKIARLSEDEKRGIGRIRAAYRARIRAKKAEIWSIEKARLEEEREIEKEGADTRLSNTDRLYGLQMKKLREKQEYGVDALKKYYDSHVEYLTMLYNPIFSGRTSKAMALGERETPLAGGEFLKEYDPLLGSYGVSAGDFSTLRARIRSQDEILNRLMRVPYRNSVPAAFRALDVLSGSIAADYERIWSALAAGLHDGDRLRERYDHAFNYALSARKEHGLILDPRDPDDILVYMNGTLNVAEGQTASVYHGERRVGVIRLNRISRGLFRGKTISLVRKNVPFRPINRIVLDDKK